MTREGRPQVGNRVVGTIVDVKGSCSWGHKVGDSFEISAHDTAGVCGFFYHDLFPKLMMLQFSGKYPWGNPDALQLECPDRHNCVKIELRRDPV